MYDFVGNSGRTPILNFAISDVRYSDLIFLKYGTYESAVISVDPVSENSVLSHTTSNLGINIVWELRLKNFIDPNVCDDVSSD